MVGFERGQDNGGNVHLGEFEDCITEFVLDVANAVLELVSCLVDLEEREKAWCDAQQCRVPWCMLAL